MNINKLDIASKLFSLATNLDLKGFSKIATDLDKIAEDYLGRSDEFAESMGGTAEPMDFDMQSLRSGAVERYEARRDAEKGEIQPKYDEYTYNYDAENDMFIVATDPNPGAPSVGFEMRRGSKGYDTLFSELSSDIRERLIKEKQRRVDSIEGIYPSRDMMLAGRAAALEELIQNIGSDLIAHLKDKNDAPLDTVVKDDKERQKIGEVETQVRTGLSTSSSAGRVIRSSLAALVDSFNLNNVSKARIIGYFDPVTEGSYSNEMLDSIAPLPDLSTGEAQPNARTETTP